MAGLDEAVAAYQAACNALCSTQSEDTSPRVMAALLSRDRLAHLLADSAPLTPDLLAGISALDRGLKDSAPAIDAAVGRATLAGWREVVQPPAGAWWWYLDQAAQAVEPRPHPLWAVLAGVCLTLAAALFIDTSQKVLSAGTDFVGVFGTLLQGLVTLTAASTLLSSGHEGLHRLLVRLGVARRFHHRWKTGLALAVMLAMLGIRLTLPAMAAYYTARYIADRALTAYATGHLYQAIDDLRRAASLDPRNVQAHYNLAVAFEEAGQYDKAEPEYQSAIALDGKFYPAFNNLARLYARKGDANGALGLVDKALPFAPPVAAVQYSLYKNRGWADLGLKLYAQAIVDLQRAIALRGDGAAAHCLLAQVYEAQLNAAAATPEWEACVGFARGDTVEASWLATGRARLAQGASK